MNTRRTHGHLLRKSSYFLPRIAFATFAAAPLGADTFDLQVGDGFGTTSFNTAGQWSSGAAPVTGNDYSVAVLNLRTPPDEASHTFAGDSLVLAPGGGLLYKGVGATGVLTIDPLVLSGGTIDHASSYLDVLTLAGSVEVAAESVIDARQGPILIQSTVTGASGLTVASSGGNAYPVTLAGATELDADITVSPGGALELGEGGTLLFEIGEPGTNRMITGGGTVTLNGTIMLDLDAVTDTVGDQWVLIGIDPFTATFGETFSIDGFTEVDGFWTSASGRLQFSERSGILKVITDDTDRDGLPDTWERSNFGNLNQFPSDDYDFDFSSNYMEFEAGSDPDDEFSFPDGDLDGLNDGWELAYFLNLDQTAGDDPDNDYNTNLEEQAVYSDPTSAFSYPDEDFDFINDGWEAHHFGSKELCDATDDPDGDLYDNESEFFDNTDPNDIFSSGDYDDGIGDGLADGWEVFWFGETGETLEEIVAKYSGSDDPDGDGYPNSAEFGAMTDPTMSDLHPSSLAHWRFEETTDGTVPVGDNTGGNQANTVLDASGVGNHMMTWRDYTSPLYRTELPFPTVPATGETNTASLEFVRDGGNLFVTDNIYTSPGVMLNSYLFDAFTIEASFRANAVNLWQVVIGKSGNPVGGQPPFTIKLRPDGFLSTGIVDGSGVAREIIGNRALVAGEWYSAAVTASATEMTLWVKAPGDAAYVAEGSVAIEGAFYSYEGLTAPWVIGLGKWNGADADPFGGFIDEVRITPEVLEVPSFLASVEAPDGDSDIDGLPDAWETANFEDLDETPGGDFDKDGTDNLTEYLLGLDPTSGASRFAVDPGSGSELTWPAAPGLTFTVWRSADLGEWEQVATIEADETSESWSDPEPLAGRGFYRVVLAD